MNPIMPAGPDRPQDQHDYAMRLLRRAAEDGSIPVQRLEEIRLALHRAAAANAAAYTQGRCGTVTRGQAEAFYRAVFCQLDAALLPLQSDSAALAALRDAAPETLLAGGQQRILAAYDRAKAAFRRAYQLTQPFETMFFRGLLQPFAKFCTEYDARFQDDPAVLNGEYPLLCRRPVPYGGVLGAEFFCTALCSEGELLAQFPEQEVRAVLRAYADRYMTSPDMIADNLAELVLLQWFGAALCGETDLTLRLPENAAETLNGRYQYGTEDALCTALQKCLAESPLADCTEVYGYVYPLLPQIAAELFRFFSAGKAAVILPAPEYH